MRAAGAGPAADVAVDTSPGTWRAVTAHGLAARLEPGVGAWGSVSRAHTTAAAPAATTLPAADASLMPS